MVSMNEVIRVVGIAVTLQFGMTPCLASTSLCLEQGADLVVSSKSGAVAFSRRATDLLTEIVWRPSPFEERGERTIRLRSDLNSELQLAISNSGRTVYYLRPSDNNPMRVFTLGIWDVDEEGPSEVERLALDKHPGLVAIGFAGLAISTDDERLAFLAMESVGEDDHFVVCVLQPRTGGVTVWRTSELEPRCPQPLYGWTEDEKGVLVGASDTTNRQTEIWRVSGEGARKVGATGASVLGVLRDGRLVLATGRREERAVVATRLRVGAASGGLLEEITEPVVPQGAGVYRVLEGPSGRFVLRDVPLGSPKPVKNTVEANPGHARKMSLETNPKTRRCLEKLSEKGKE